MPLKDFLLFFSLMAEWNGLYNIGSGRYGDYLHEIMLHVGVKKT